MIFLKPTHQTRADFQDLRQFIFIKSFSTTKKTLFMENLFEGLNKLKLASFERYNKINENPLVKSFKKSIIIGSLGLIIIKLMFPTTIYIRLLSYVLFVIIAMIFNLREKIKTPISWFLKKSLGFEFYFMHFHTLDKEDYFISRSPENKIYIPIYKIYFEITWYLRYLFQQFYISINGIRLFFDNNLYYYIVIYYVVFFSLVFFDKSIFISYIALFLTLSKLIIYISENNFSEVLVNLTQDGHNLALLEKKLKLTKKNIMIFTFWNIRDIERNDYTKNYLIDTLFIQSMNIYYNFCEYFDDEIPFDYKEKSNVLFFFNMLTLKVTKDKIEHINYIQYNNNIFKKIYAQVLSRVEGHDNRVRRSVIQFDGKNPIFVESWTTMSSCKASKHFMTPLGSKLIGVHSNMEKNDSTHEVPLCFWESDSEENLEKITSEFKKKTSTAKFIKDNTPCEIPYYKGICMNKISSNATIASIQEHAIIGALKTKINNKFNFTQVTYGELHNELFNGNKSKIESISKQLLHCFETHLTNVSKLLIDNYKRNGGEPTHQNFMLNREYAQAWANNKHIKENIYQQQEFKSKMHEELSQYIPADGMNIKPSIIKSISSID